MKKPYFITTAISYVNGAPHLGHAYESILTDVMARFRRLDGNDVFFLTGTDEHGEKVAVTAEKNGMDPRAFCDKIAAEFINLTKKLNLSNDFFIRTTEDRHYKASQALWQQIEKNGDIYLDKYGGWYSVRDEAYVGEDELSEVDGKNLAPSGAEVVWKEEESYFFRLSNYTDKLLAYYEANPEFIQPEARLNEVRAFVSRGLKDLSISRTNFNWGVPVPGDKRHVMYVWLDALTNYITAIGYPDIDSEMYKKYWPADVHVIGKDITRFHAVFWPAFLMSAGLSIPKRIFAHGFINVEGQKMSKSIGNVMAPENLVATYGLDPLRYFLMREIPHGQDGNFSHTQAVLRINSDLANGLGNLAQRTLSMIAKNCDEQIPAPGAFTAEDKILLDAAQVKMLAVVRIEFDRQRFHRALEEIWNVVNAANGYIDAQAPWGLKKTDPTRMGTVLYVLAETIRCLGLIVQPFMPDSAAKILDQVVIPANERDFTSLASANTLKPGTKIPPPQGVFPRIVEDETAT